MELMNESSHGNEGHARDRVHHRDGPYWKRLHRHWWFWVGLAAMFAAITIYVLSENLSLLPHG